MRPQTMHVPVHIKDDRHMERILPIRGLSRPSGSRLNGGAFFFRYLQYNIGCNQSANDHFR